MKLYMSYLHGFNRNLIDAEILIGDHTNKRVFIPIIIFLLDSNESTGFPFKPIQVHIKLSFVMMINKSQGQILDFIRIYFPGLIFSHGQLHMALSIARTTSLIKILIRPMSNIAYDKKYISNIICRDLLALSEIP